MRVTYIGHAGLLIEAGDVTVVCDPWLSRHGAFDGGWFQLPQNHHLADMLRARHINAIYLSHEHCDHFDPEFLDTLPRDITLIVPGYPSKEWRAAVRALGFDEVRFFKSFEEQEVAPGVRVTILHAPTPYFHDSGFVLAEDATGQVLVNLNDCKISDDQATEIRRRHPHITAAFVQFSGATWFPFVYEFPLEERVAAARQKVRNGMNRWRKYVHQLDPRWTVPFAGPPALLDRQTRAYGTGPDSIFPNHLDLLRYLEKEDPELAARYVMMLPGDTLDLATGVWTKDAAMHAGFQWENVGPYVDAYAERMAPNIAESLAAYPWPEEPLFPAFKVFFEELFAAAPGFANQVDAAVLFTVEGPGGGRWLTDFRRLTVEDVTGDPRPREELCEYEFRADSRFVPPLLDQRLRWEDFPLSFRFHAWRRGVDTYNENLMAFLRFGRPNELKVQDMLLARARRAYSQESFILRTERGDFEVQQFCPHMGERLGPQHYDAERCAIVCPRHGWQFSVPDGACLNARANLRIKPAEAATAGADPR
ncbi:MAG: MBL fold metallo-hydrolase [Dehalococcoidia bacterium]